MSTLLQLRTRVRQYLDEPTAVYWQDVEINNWINQAYNYYYTQIAEGFDGYFTKATTLDIIATQALYPVPIDFWKVRLLERVFSTFTIPLRLYERMEAPNITANGNYSNLYTPTYRFQGQNILLEPTPDITIVGGLRLEYLPIPTLMAADGDSPDPGYLQNWDEALVLRATLSCKQKEEAVVNSGTDAASIMAMLESWEQTIKESVELRSTQRHYSEPFGLDEGASYFYT